MNTFVVLCQNNLSKFDDEANFAFWLKCWKFRMADYFAVKWQIGFLFFMLCIKQF